MTYALAKLMPGISSRRAIVSAKGAACAAIESAEKYTVRDAIEDWLSKGLKGRDPATIVNNRILAGRHVVPLIGACKLKDLRADHVDEWLDGLTGKLSSDSLRKVHSILKRAIRQAQARNKVLRNVAPWR